MNVYMIFAKMSSGYDLFTGLAYMSDIEAKENAARMTANENSGLIKEFAVQAVIVMRELPVSA